MREVDCVLDDVPFVLQRRIDVDCGIGDEERPRIGRHIDNEDVADAPLGTQAGSPSTTACISSSVCSAPFISASTLPARAIATA